MVRIDVRIDPAVRRVMASLVAAMDQRGLWREPAAGVPEDDPDLRQTWVDDLRTEAQEDTARLRRLLEDVRLGREALEVPASEAESLVRACSTVRLRLRETGLARIKDEDLEAGAIPPDQLPVAERRLFGCYLFLAGLQSLLIARLDPEAVEPDEDEEHPE